MNYVYKELSILAHIIDEAKS